MVHSKTRQAGYGRKHYLANKQSIIRKNGERKRQISAWVRSYKCAHPCIYCGESEPCCLDFHHRDQADKIITIALAINMGWSIASLQTEIAKCDVVCSNCHRKIHAGVLKINPK